MKKLFSPKLKMIMAMVIFGTIAPFVAQTCVSSTELALYRAGIAVIMVGAYLLIRGEKISLFGLGAEAWLLLISGAALGFNWILLFEAFSYTSVSAATLSYYFAPVLVIVLSPVLFHEKLSPVQILCFIMSTFGIVLITGFDGEGSRHFTGILLALSAACLYASVILINKCIRRVQGLQRTFFQFAAAFAVLLPYVLFTSGLRLSGVDAKGIVFILIVGVVHTSVAYLLYFSAIGSLAGKTAAVLSYIDPLVAVAVSLTVLREGVTAAKLIGGALVLGFTLLHELLGKAEGHAGKN